MSSLTRLRRRLPSGAKLTLVLLLVVLFYHVTTPPLHSDVMADRWIRYRAYQKSEPHRLGPGEKGAPVLLEGEEKRRAENLTKTEAFNRLASDKISLSRSVLDSRIDG